MGGCQVGTARVFEPAKTDTDIDIGSKTLAGMSVLAVSWEEKASR